MSLIEEKKEVRTYLVKAYCPDCKQLGFDNELIKSNQVLMTYPPKHQYSCDCGYTTSSTTSYPYLSYE